ncbi:MAG: GGDEF domain-containing response regulator [Fibrobacterota bacterium]
MSYILFITENPLQEKERFREHTARNIRFVSSAEAAVKVYRQQESFCLALIISIPLKLDIVGKPVIPEELVTLGPPLILFQPKDSSEYPPGCIGHDNIIEHLHGDRENAPAQLVGLFDQLEKNMRTRILVIDDDPFFRKMLGDMLRRRLYDVLTSSDVAQSLKFIREQPEIKLVITDYSMPYYDGCRLTGEIRKIRSKDEIAIIGMSAYSDSSTPAEFIKNGANDFVVKQSLSTEEFYCRVNLNIENIHYINSIKNHSPYNGLTGLYSRQYLRDAGDKYLQNGLRKNIDLLYALFTIANLEDIRQSYGDSVGDYVVYRVGTALSRRFRSTDLFAHAGPERFGLLAVNFEHRHIKGAFEEVLNTLTKDLFSIPQSSLSLNVSIAAGLITSNRYTDIETAFGDCAQLIPRTVHLRKNTVILQ